MTWEHRAPSPTQHMMPICEVGPGKTLAAPCSKLTWVAIFLAGCSWVGTPLGTGVGNTSFMSPVLPACLRLKPTVSPRAAGPAGAAVGAQRDSMPVVVCGCSLDQSCPWTLPPCCVCRIFLRRGAASSAGSWRPTRGQEPCAEGSLPPRPWTFSHQEFGHSPIAAPLTLLPMSLCQWGLNKYLCLTNASCVPGMGRSYH